MEGQSRETVMILVILQLPGPTCCPQSLLLVPVKNHNSYDATYFSRYQSRPISCHLLSLLPHSYVQEKGGNEVTNPGTGRF